MIVAAAIKFHIDKTDEDVVLCGVRHGDCFAQLKGLGFEPKEGYREIEQGFVDNKGNFLNRREAWHTAAMCMQLPLFDILEKSESGPELFRKTFGNLTSIQSKP